MKSREGGMGSGKNKGLETSVKNNLSERIIIIIFVAT